MTLQRLEVRECSTSRAYREVSIVQILSQTGILSSHLRTFVDNDQNKLALSVVKDQICTEHFKVASRVLLEFSTTVTLYA